MRQTATIWQQLATVRSFAIVFFLALIGLMSPAAHSAAGTLNTTDQRIKVAYLYQLTQFIEWPATAFNSSNSGFRICIVGNTLSAKQLRPLTRKTHHKRPISINFSQSTRDIRACHLLYIDTADNSHEEAVLNKYKNAPLLTVSSQPEFTARGGIIGFVIVDERVRLEVNRMAARHANIKLSAKLLEVAITVIGAPSQEKQP